MELVRKQITIPKPLERKMARIAKESNRTFSEVVKEALSQYASFMPRKSKTEKQETALRNMIGMYSSGVMNGSINHDQELYG